MSLCGRVTTPERPSWLSPHSRGRDSQRGRPILNSPEVIIRTHFHVALSPHILLFSIFSRREKPFRSDDLSLTLSGDPGRPLSQKTKRPSLSAWLCEQEVRPFSLALCLARRGPHYRAASRRGGRSRATLCFPAGSRGSQKATAQTSRVSFILSCELA